MSKIFSLHLISIQIIEILVCLSSYLLSQCWFYHSKLLTQSYHSDVWLSFKPTEHLIINMDMCSCIDPLVRSSFSRLIWVSSQCFDGSFDQVMAVLILLQQDNNWHESHNSHNHQPLLISRPFLILLIIVPTMTATTLATVTMHNYITSTSITNTNERTGVHNPHINDERMGVQRVHLYSLLIFLLTTHFRKMRLEHTPCCVVLCSELWCGGHILLITTTSPPPPLTRNVRWRGLPRHRRQTCKVCLYFLFVFLLVLSKFGPELMQRTGTGRTEPLVQFWSSSVQPLQLTVRFSVLRFLKVWEPVPNRFEQEPNQLPSYFKHIEIWYGRMFKFLWLWSCHIGTSSPTECSWQHNDDDTSRESQNR